MADEQRGIVLVTGTTGSGKSTTGKRTRGAFYRGLRLMSLDGTCLDVADTPENAAAFGRPGTQRGHGVGAFPQLRLVGLAECGTHAITSAAFGPCTSSEVALADELFGWLGPGVLCLADRGFYGFERFGRARASGAQLIWRVGANVQLPREQTLGDDEFVFRHNRRGTPMAAFQTPRPRHPTRAQHLPPDHPTRRIAITEPTGYASDS